MKKLLNFKNIVMFFIAVFLVFVLPLMARAEGEETGTLKYGRTKAVVNVREGPGSTAYAIKKHNDKNLQLAPDTPIFIMDEAVEGATGIPWYHVFFYDANNEQLEGWIISIYAEVTGTVTTTPTPTPEVTETPTPTPTETPTPTPTEAPQSPTPTQAPKVNDKSPLYRLFWRVVIAVLAISAVVVITIYIYNRFVVSKGKSDEINKKMKYLKTVAENSEEPKYSGVASVKRPQVRVVDDGSGDVTRSAEQENEPDERAILRAKLDKLKQHDIVDHKFFGKGEVYDNSDVRLMEVRFGMDVRYLNKDSLAAKKLLTFEEDDSIITRKKL